MARYSFTTWFKIGEKQGLVVDADLAGFSWIVRGDPFDVRIRLPERSDTLAAEGAYEGWSGPEEAPRALLLAYIEASALFEADVDEEAEAAPSVDERSPYRWARAALAASRAAIQDFRGWVRLNQPWLGPQQSYLSQVRESVFVNLDTDRRLPGLVEMGATTLLEANPLGKTGLEIVTEQTRSGLRAPVPESILSDAFYLGGWAHPPDFTRAVLLAAIACEVKAKNTLTELAPLPAAPLLDAMLSLPRAFPFAAIDLFDSVAGAILGRSLRKQDAGLFKRVRHLFEIRNQIAHRAQEPDQEKAKDVLRAAKEAFDWLNEGSALR
jgi:hypothetical protein